MPTIILVVEGDGDLAAAPILLNRILLERLGRTDVAVAYGKQGVVNAHGRQNLESRLETLLGHALEKSECDAILILLDADSDCPVELAGKLRQACQAIQVLCPVEIVCANREYESWFLASLDTIRGRHGIPESANLTQAAENISNPKAWLSGQMPFGVTYKEVSHQPAMSGLIDLEAAHANSRSFRRLCHAVELLLGGMAATAA